MDRLCFFCHRLVLSFAWLLFFFFITTAFVCWFGDGRFLWVTGGGLARGFGWGWGFFFPSGSPVFVSSSVAVSIVSEMVNKNRKQDWVIDYSLSVMMMMAGKWVSACVLCVCVRVMNFLCFAFFLLRVPRTCTVEEKKKQKQSTRWRRDELENYNYTINLLSRIDSSLMMNGWCLWQCIYAWPMYLLSSIHCNVSSLVWKAIKLQIIYISDDRYTPCTWG